MRRDALLVAHSNLRSLYSLAVHLRLPKIVTLLVFIACTAPCRAAPPLGCTQPSDSGCTTSGGVVCWGYPPLEEAGGYLLTNFNDGSTSGSSNGGGGAAEGGADGGGGAGDAAAAAAALNSTQVWTVLDTDLKFISLSAENSFVCGLTTSATLACWGAGLVPELVAAAATDADPAAPQQGSPGTVAELPAAAVGGAPLLKVVTGETFVCGLLHNYSLACLGTIGGQEWSSGAGGASSPLRPLPVAGGEPGAARFVDVAAGAQHLCGVTFSGMIACLGSNSASQLGRDSSQLGSSPTPLLVGDPSLAFTSVAAGDAFSCGLLSNGSAACWGGYADAAGEQALPPTLRLIPGQTFQSLAAKGATVCGITTADSHLVCTGVISSYIDADGYPEQMISEEPVVIDSLRTYVSVTVGGSGFYFHACGLEASGEALCWGLDNEGQLGVDLGSRASALAGVTPAPVDTQLRFSSIAAGGAFTCGVVA